MLVIPKPALSVRQPFAWAIIHGGKPVENRSKAAIRHGLAKPQRIGIHASLGMTRNEYECGARFMLDIGVTCPFPADLVRGGIIGTVEVVGAVTEHDSPWFFGPCGIVLRNPEPFTPMSLVKGQLGLFKPVFTGQPLPAPKPWMQNWPSEHGRKLDPQTTTPLFGETPIRREKQGEI